MSDEILQPNPEFEKAMETAREEIESTINKLQEVINADDAGRLVHAHIGVAVADEKGNVFNFKAAFGSKHAVEDMLIQLLNKVHNTPLSCECGCEQFELVEEEDELGEIEVSDKGVIVKPHVPPSEESKEE